MKNMVTNKHSFLKKSLEAPPPGRKRFLVMPLNTVAKLVNNGMD